MREVSGPPGLGAPASGASRERRPASGTTNLSGCRRAGRVESVNGWASRARRGCERQRRVGCIEGVIGNGRVGRGRTWESRPARTHCLTSVRRAPRRTTSRPARGHRRRASAPAPAQMDLPQKALSRGAPTRETPAASAQHQEESPRHSGEWARHLGEWAGQLWELTRRLGKSAWQLGESTRYLAELTRQQEAEEKENDGEELLPKARRHAARRPQSLPDHRTRAQPPATRMTPRPQEIRPRTPAADSRTPRHPP
jgi:hypothetical protein